MNLNYNPWKIKFSSSSSSSLALSNIFNGFAVPVCLLLLIKVVFYFICLYIVYHVYILTEFVKLVVFSFFFLHVSLIQ